MPSIPEIIEQLEAAMRRVEAAEIELATAKSEQRRLEREVLPPLFTTFRQKVFVHENGTKATKRLGVWARWPKDGPQREKATAWMKSIGMLDALKATVTATWGKGEYHLAEAALASLKKDSSAAVKLTEDIHWKTYENIVLSQFQGGYAVPFDDINANVFDEVTLTERPSHD